MRWFSFRQNNSGGTFVQDEDVDIHVFIEADDAIHANEYAKLHGIYFDGVSKGRDCSCCGDRWYEVDDGDYDVYNTIPDTIKHLRQYDLNHAIYYFRAGAKVYGRNIKMDGSFKKVTLQPGATITGGIVLPQLGRTLELL